MLFSCFSCLSQFNHCYVAWSLKKHEAAIDWVNRWYNNYHLKHSHRAPVTLNNPQKTVLTGTISLRKIDSPPLHLDGAQDWAQDLDSYTQNDLPNLTWLVIKYENILFNCTSACLIKHLSQQHKRIRWKVWTRFNIQSDMLWFFMIKLKSFSAFLWVELDSYVRQLPELDTTWASWILIMCWRVWTQWALLWKWV